MFLGILILGNRDVFRDGNYISNYREYRDIGNRFHDIGI